MEKRCMLFVAALLFGFVVPAFAEPPTEALLGQVFTCYATGGMTPEEAAKDAFAKRSGLTLDQVEAGFVPEIVEAPEGSLGKMVAKMMRKGAAAPTKADAPEQFDPVRYIAPQQAGKATFAQQMELDRLVKSGNILATDLEPFVASHRPPTKDQRVELNKLIESGAISAADFEAFLAIRRTPKADAPGTVPLTLTVETTHAVTVDCDSNAAAKAGKYDRVFGRIIPELLPERLPEASCKAGRAEVSLVRCSRDATTLEILVELDRMGLRASTLPELLALGAVYPDLQKKFRIGALGSGSQISLACRVVRPLLSVHNGERRLHLDWCDSDRQFDASIRFAAVRK